jgi:hypothetical protein
LPIIYAYAMGDSIQPIRKGRPPKIADQVWLEIENRYVSGDTSLKDLALEFGLKYQTVLSRSKDKRWLSPQRISRALTRTDLPPQDTAKQIADRWAARKEEMREKLYKGATKALDTFWLMSPIPQDFTEAEKAMKMLDKAINPDEGKTDSSINLSILTNGFNPSPIVDI